MYRVLLIDDHPVVRAGLRAIVDSFDDLTVVGEGSDGSAVDEYPDVDVIVCDLQMPRVDGVEATRRAKAPVLVLSTFHSQADIVAALEAGA